MFPVPRWTKYSKSNAAQISLYEGTDRFKVVTTIEDDVLLLLSHSMHIRYWCLSISVKSSLGIKDSECVSYFFLGFSAFYVIIG